MSGYRLHLAATPTFAIMAVLASVAGSGSQDSLCSAAGASPLTGMVPMYLLMSLFHSAPWLRRISRRLEEIGRNQIQGDMPAVPESLEGRSNQGC
jgi:hypothetical protein